MKHIFILLLLFCTSAYRVHSTKETVGSNEISLPNGRKLKGVLQKSFHGEKPYVEFRGLRYARPPQGSLRFKPTYLFDDIWESLGEDATEYGEICPQLDPWYDPEETEDGSWDQLKVIGNEDCLFANVATSNTNPETLLPVLVWIPGGNFQSESGQDYKADKLMDYDVVVVTFNYRLGLLGFLNTEDGIYNGNQGLKDQSILLQWVQKTIHLFGGDPDKVTCAGSNVGATSVHLHMLSNFSLGLFHKAIIMSGTAISPWILMRDPKERLNKIAKHLQCGNDTEVSSCFAEKDAVAIIQKLPKMAEWFLDPLVPFGPSIEMFGDMRDRFLAKDPYNYLMEGNYWARDIPVIMGVNSHEGLLHAMDIGHQGMLRMVFNLEWFGSAPISLYYKNSAVDPRSVSEAVRNYYFPQTEEEKANGSAPILVDKNHKFDNLTNLYSDRHFFVPLHHSAKLMGRSHELYLFWFDYVSDQSIHGLYGYNESQILGPSHYDQLQYLFVTPFFNQTKEKHKDFERQFLNGIYKFISTGLPLWDNWVKITADMVEKPEPLVYNRIGLTSQSITEPFFKRIDFWQGLILMEYDQGNFINEFMKQDDVNSAQKIEL